MSWFRNNNGQISAKRVAVAGGTGLVTAAIVSATVFLSQSDKVGAPMTQEFEGTVLANYLDVVGVETWCAGETQVGRLEKGYTIEYCRTLFKKRYHEFSSALYTCYNTEAKKYVTPAMHAAFTDVFFNTGAKCNTGMIRNLKQGNPVEACNFILKYKRAGGKDCSIKANGCYGVWDRRLKFFPLCMNDAKRIPEEGIGP